MRKPGHPTRQDLLELVEELAVGLAAVEPAELAEQVTLCIVRLEILAACDAHADELLNAFRVGWALVETCEKQLRRSDPRRRTTHFDSTLQFD